MDKQELLNECEMLQSDIDVMMTTNSRTELLNTFTYAIRRVSDICWANRDRINMQDFQKGQENDSSNL
jgi:hypothetical protein